MMTPRRLLTRIPPPTRMMKRKPAASRQDVKFIRALFRFAPHPYPPASSSSPRTYDVPPPLPPVTPPRVGQDAAQDEDDPVPPLVEVHDYDSSIDTDSSEGEIALNVSSDSRDCGMPDAWSEEDERFAAPPPPWSDSMAPSPDQRRLDYDVMAGAVRPSWLSTPLTHDQMAAKARAASSSRPQPP